MPTYQETKTYRGGFYNNHVVGGNNDRVYTANDVRKPYDTVFTDGILPEADGMPGDCLKVSSTGGMGISVGIGNAKLGGAWFENTMSYNITLDVGGSTLRYDCVIIRNDDSEDVREPSIYIKSLTSPPKVSDLTRNDNVYEICVGYVQVAALASSISARNIVDTRTHGTLCNVMSGVGATVVRVYKNTYFSETANQKVISIGIKQYNKEKDRLTVIVEGRTFTEGANYTISDDNSSITLAVGLPVVGTKIDFEVAKNVNAAGAETVVQEVAELREEMTAANKILEYDYYCNGVNDNVKLSEIAQAWLTGGTDYGGKKINVFGTFGCSAPYLGSGASDDHSKWFALGNAVSRNRRITFDFTACSTITLPIEDGTYNDIFYGNDIHIIGASVVASNSATGTYIRMFNSANGVILAENCRFWITANVTSYISQTGTFKNCRGSVTTTGANAYCFYPTANALLRVEGGEYYAYAASAYTSAVVYGTASTLVAILYAVNCPTAERGGYVQSYAVYTIAGNVSITDTITTLAITATGANIRGTLAISKAGQM